jgi:hypothetical protein
LREGHLRPLSQIITIAELKCCRVKSIFSFGFGKLSYIVAT